MFIYLFQYYTTALPSAQLIRIPQSASFHYTSTLKTHIFSAI